MKSFVILHDPPDMKAMTRDEAQSRESRSLEPLIHLMSHYIVDLSTIL